MRCLLAALLLLGSACAAADEAEARGLAIATEMERRDAGFGDSVAEAAMVLTDRAGGQIRRAFRTSLLERPDDADRSLVVFSLPRDIAGTALLTHAHRERDEDQWIHLPALRRTKRIASRGRTGAFVSSDFAYEDLTPWALERYAYRHLRDEPLEGRPSLVVEMRPRFADSGYVRQVVWVDAERWQPVRIDYHDLGPEPLKTLHGEDWRLYAGRHWRPHRLRMVDRSGRHTLIEIASYAFATGLGEIDFDSATLQRAAP